MEKVKLPSEEDNTPEKKVDDKTGRYIAFLNEVGKMKWSKDEARVKLLGKEWYSCKVCLKTNQDEK